MGVLLLFLESKKSALIQFTVDLNFIDISKIVSAVVRKGEIALATCTVSTIPRVPIPFKKMLLISSALKGD